MRMLNALEIGLRNEVHSILTQLYRSEGWWREWTGRSEFARPLDAVNDAKIKLMLGRERVTSDKFVAELTLGFWCSLFTATRTSCGGAFALRFLPALGRTTQEGDGACVESGSSASQ